MLFVDCGVTHLGAYDVFVVSKEQLAFARESCKGLDVTFVEDDYRNARESGLFDRIYSIGFENTLSLSPPV